jgi:hypothetical protein
MCREGQMKKRKARTKPQKPKVLVGRVSSLRVAAVSATAARKEGAVVNFASGDTAELDPKHRHADAFANIVSQAREASLPLYVEVNPRTKKIADVQIPLEGTVSSINIDTAGNAELEIQISHSIHVLRKDNPSFKRLLAAAQRAMTAGERVAVTERQADGIIDIRPAEAPAGGAPPAVTEAPPFEQAARDAAATAAATAVTPARAKQLFDMCKSKSCNPKTVPPPCIPFLYPDDGCWGRASEMCRLIIASSVQPAKIWIYGRLQARTRNNPACMVRWGWHVTATLQVQVGPRAETQAIDPSLFDAPVSLATWKSVQGDTAALLAASAANVFYRDRNGNVQYDPTYAQTNQVLATYRLQLQLRSLSSVGPPPYKNCP